MDDFPDVIYQLNLAHFAWLLTQSADARQTVYTVSWHATWLRNNFNATSRNNIAIRRRQLSRTLERSISMNSRQLCWYINEKILRHTVQREMLLKACVLRANSHLNEYKTHPYPNRGISLNPPIRSTVLKLAMFIAGHWTELFDHSKEAAGKYARICQNVKP